MHRKICLRSAVIALLWVSAVAQAQEPSPAQTAPLEELLRHIETRKRLVTQELAQIENRVNTETNQIMALLDRVFQETIPPRIKQHYQDVETALQKVGLPDDVGKIDVVLSQYKAVLSSKDLGDIITRFFERAMRETESERENLTKAIDTELNEVLQVELPRAQDNIRAPFQKVLLRHFPVWQAHGLATPALPSINLNQSAEGMHGSGVKLLGGLGGVLILTLRKRITRMIVTKIGKQALGKLVPVVGWVLTGMALWDATQAKAKLEEELRPRFLAEYTSVVTVEGVLWKGPGAEGEISSRETYARDVHTQLDEWAKQCQKEAERMLGVSHMFTLSPNVREYMTAQGQKGRSTLEVVEDMTAVGEVFDASLIGQASIERLLDMIRQAPDKQELARLANELGSQLLDEYAKHGRTVLVAAHALGVPLFLEVVRAGKGMHWATVQRAFEDYPRDLPEPARRGLLLLLTEGVAHTGVPPSTLQRIAHHATTFRTLAPVLKAEPGKLFEMFANDQVLQLITKGYAKNAEITQAFVKAWPVLTWERYKDVQRFQALFAVAQYRTTERRQPVEAFASEIAEQDKLTFLYQDAGLDAVRLWDAHVGSQAGAHQYRLAEQATDLYKAGYPRDALVTVEGIKFAAFCNAFPFGGLKAYHLLHPLGQAAYLAVVLCAIVLLAVPALVLLRLVRGAMRKSPQPQA